MAPLVSIIIPCRNEEKYIKKCLDSLISQDYPKENLEILVIDGMSEDNTRKIIDSYLQKHSFIKLVDNPDKTTPYAMNIGIEKSKGEIIVRADAHTEYPQGYISRCIEELLKYKKEEKVGNVGGSVNLPPTEGFEEIKKRFEEIEPGKKYNIDIARAIAVCVSHPFGAASRFRLGAKKSTFTDTVFGGCYRKEVFREVGLFNEKLSRSQDLEFNLRMKKAGWKIRLISDITFNYYPKPNFKDFFWHNFDDGFWATYPLRFGAIFKLRHYIPLIFIGSLIVLSILSFLQKIFLMLLLLEISLYFFLSIYFSFKATEKHKDVMVKYVFRAFFCRHFGYGLGSLWGTVRLLR